MPVQINEMIIRANVQEPQENAAEKKPAPDSANKEEIIKECVEAVLEVLKHKNER